MQKPKLLVARLSSLGDVVLTAPVYRNLRAKWPEAEIRVLTKPQFVSAISGHPCVDSAIAYKGFFRTLSEIRAGGFTHYLDLHSNPRTLLLGFFSGIKNRARYKKDSLARRFFVGLGIPSPALARHTLERYLESLSAWDVPVKYRENELSDWSPQKSETRTLGSICVLQTAFLGDAVLTLPLIAEMAKAFPEAKITVAARPETADVFRSSAAVSEVIVDDKRKAGFFKSFFALARELKNRRFDAVVTPHRSLRTALAAYLSGAKIRVGFHTSAGEFLFNRLVPFSWLLHDAERNLSLLNGLARLPAAHSPLAAERPDAAKTVAERLGEGNFIGVHPGSAWLTKRWPAGRYCALIKKLEAECGVKAVLVGGKDDSELCGKIAAESGALNWAGSTGIPELMALMGRLKLFVTNDSGPMHIATAFKVPTLAIFGPTTKELGFFPYGEGHRVLEAQLRCRPCALHGSKKCPRGHFLCMKLITAEDAFRAARQMLK